MLPSILSAGQSIAAIAGRDPQKLKQFQRDFTIPSAYLDLDSVLRDPAVDAVYIALPNSMHAEWSVRALAAGKRVVCEKPLALNLAEADRVIAAARKGVLLENFCYGVPEIPAGLLRIEVEFCFQATQEHRSRYSRALGGGSFLDMGCYGVDFVHRVLGDELQILDVHAVRRKHDGDDAGGEVDEDCRVEARCGLIAIAIHSSFAAPACQDYLLYASDGSLQRVQRSDDTSGMLRAFAQRTASDPADLIRWRRNACVYQDVLARMAY